MTALSRLGRMLRLRRADRPFIDLPPVGPRAPFTPAQEARIHEIARCEVVRITAQRHRQSPPAEGTDVTSRSLGGRS